MLSSFPASYPPSPSLSLDTHLPMCMSGMCVWVCGHPPVCSCPQDDAERESIQQEMMEDIVSGGPAILEALSQTATAESWVQNRMQEHRNKTMREAQKLKHLDQDDDAMALETDKFVRSTTSLVDTSGPRPQAVVDLDQMAFPQGAQRF